MKIALILAPWYRREAPSPDVAMTTAVLGRDGHEVKVFDFNNELFGSNFKNRVYWKNFIVRHDEKDVSEFYELAASFFDEYAGHIISSRRSSYSR
jgi:hypothetical protein